MTRYPWLDGRYVGAGFCQAGCRYELPRKLYWWDGARTCSDCYVRLAGEAPPKPRTAETLKEGE